MGHLDGRRALVTGGASGIGLAIATRCLIEGASVVALDLAPSRPSSLPADIGYVVADISNDQSVRAAVADAITMLGGLDLLVNNAGIGAQGTVEDNDDDEWRRVLDVNIVGTARVSRAAWPHLKVAESAVIINVASIAACVGLPNRALYSASKGGVQSLTFAMAADGLRDGIRVNALNPGTVDTPWVQRLLAAADDPATERAALEARQPHGRLVSADEVAHAAIYLASPAAGSVTGTALAVDGGLAILRLPPQTKPE